MAVALVHGAVLVKRCCCCGSSMACGHVKAQGIGVGRCSCGGMELGRVEQRHSGTNVRQRRTGVDSTGVGGTVVAATTGAGALRADTMAMTTWAQADWVRLQLNLGYMVAPMM